MLLYEDLQGFQVGAGGGTMMEMVTNIIYLSFSLGLYVFDTSLCLSTALGFAALPMALDTDFIFCIPWTQFLLLLL